MNGGHPLGPYHQLNRKGPQQTAPMLKSLVMKEATKVQQQLYHSRHWHHWYHLHHAWAWGVYGYVAGSSPTTVVGVPSGNSLSVTNAAGVPQRVRLAGVGAPVVGQALFSESRDNLDSIANGKQVRVVAVGTDFDGAMVAQVFLNSGDYVNEMQVRSGLAWNAVDDGFDMTLAGAEESAQMSGAGMWNGDYAPNF
jgi:endonuclease YncB( thermonuclease family)